MGFVADADPTASAPEQHGFVPDPEPGQGDALYAPPNMAQGNKVFARTLGDAFGSMEGFKSAASQVGEGAMKTVTNVGQVYPALEAAMNAGTGLLFGLPAAIGGAIGGMGHKFGVVTPFGTFGGDRPDYDYSAIAQQLQKLVTYQPMTSRGTQLTGDVGNVMGMGGTFAGHAVASGLVKLGDPGQLAAPAGAITEQAIQMIAPGLIAKAAGLGAAQPETPPITPEAVEALHPVLQAELSRKLGGQTVGPDDMANVAKVVAGPDAAPEAVQATEASLHSVYEKTGIGPYTIAEEAAKNPELKAELADPSVDVPKAIEPFIPKEPEPAAPTPGDGLPLLDTSGPTRAEQTAYHGSPHDFDAFDIAKIGTGEGAQAYGHGLYFAENPEVASGYQKNLASTDFTYSDPDAQARMKTLTNFDDHVWKTLDEISKRNGADPKATADALRAYAARYSSGRDAINTAADFIEQGKMTPQPAGRLYRVSIPAEHVANMLDWDKPLSEQPDIQRAVAGDSLVKEAYDHTIKFSNGNAESFYDMLANSVGGTKEASERLQSLGIPGIKYLDQGSRNAGGWKITPPSETVAGDWMVKSSDYNSKGLHFATEDEAKAALAEKISGDTRNLVVFDDKIVKITHKNGEPVQPESIPAATMAEHGIVDTPETRQQLALATQAATINPDAVAVAAKQFAKDEPGFHQAIQEIIDGHEEQSAVASQGSVGAGEESATANADNGPTGDIAQPSSDTFRSGAGDLNAGLNPAAALKSFGEGYSNYVGVEADHAKPPAVDSQGQPVSRFADDMRRVLAPASRGPVAAQQAGIMRANFGEMAHEAVVAEHRLFDFAKTFDAMPVEENVKFIDAYEHGTPLEDPKLAAAATALKSMNDGLREQIQDLGKGQLENFDENYLGRIWKDPDTAGRDLYARRPLEGNKNFLKERTIPFYTDGLQWRAYDSDGEFVKSFPTETEAKLAAGTDGRVGAPLEPITTNPVEMALLKGKEMRKYIYGQRIFQEMKDADLARFVPFGGQAPPGWTKINDKIGRVLQPNEGEGGGMILRGEYYAPDEAATLINNHLSPSAFQGNSFFDAWRTVGNSINALQLGLSLFHVGFTSMDAIISKATLGVKQISRGDIGEGLGNLGMAMTGPVQSINNLMKGDKLLRAYNGDIDSPELSPLVEAIQDAGGRVKIDDFYRNESVNAFRQAIRNEQYGAAAKAFLPTVLDRISSPIFEWLVPRQKLGVFADMANDWLEHNQDAGLTERREGLGKLWDSVDNRMGQLVYDNVFWNRTLKDGLMASVRSVGWNLGTFRELGGGAADLWGTGKDLVSGNYKGLTDRTSYLIALPMMAATYGAITHYAYNGTPPETLKDAFYPRTGRTRPDGSPDRVSLPTYMKDVYAYGNDASNFAQYGTNPLQTIANKANPLISTVSQMLNNQDYFGGAIRNPGDPAVQQLADEARYILQQVEPFSYRNYIQQSKEKGEKPTALGYLTSPSMVGITPAPGYITKTPEQLETSQVNRMRDPLIQKYKEAIKNGMSVQEAIPEMQKGGLSRTDIQYVVKSSLAPRQPKPKQFGK